MNTPSTATVQARLHALLRDEYGLDLSRGGTEQSLAEFVEARGAAIGEHDLVDRVLSNVEGERDTLIHAITVQHTWFFRDPNQLDEIAAFFQTRSRELGRPLEVWVAGCATGEEAWTLMMIAESLAVPIHLLATDVDPAAIVDARAAIYREVRLHGLPPAMLGWFRELGGGLWILDTDRLLDERNQIEFAVHNLCEPAPTERRFDLICCRNVLIYFESERASACALRLRASLAAQGRLVLGSADLLTDPAARSGPGTPLVRPRIHEPSTPLVNAPAPRSHRPSAPEPSPRVMPSPPSLAPKPRPPDDPLLRASQAITAGQPEVALALLDALVVGDPMQAELQFWIGLAHHHAGRPAQAIPAFRRASCLAPEFWPANLFAALAHERLHDAPAALRCWTALERALEDPAITPIDASLALTEVLPGWRGEALALARLRSSPSILRGRNHDSTENHLARR